MEEANMLDTPTLDGATPRFLLENIMQRNDVQQTVKRRRRKKRGLLFTVKPNKSRRSTPAAQMDISTEVLDSTITPRTALMGAMAASEHMSTVHRPKRKRRLSQPDKVLHEQPEVVVQENEESSQQSDQSMLDIPLSQPLISTDEYQNKLNAKLAVFKEAKAKAAILKELSLERVKPTPPKDEDVTKKDFNDQSSFAAEVSVQNESSQPHDAPSKDELLQSAESEQQQAIEASDDHSMEKSTEPQLQASANLSKSVDDNLKEGETVQTEPSSLQEDIPIENIEEGDVTLIGIDDKISVLVNEEEGTSIEQNQKEKSLKGSINEEKAGSALLGETKIAKPMRKVPKPSFKMFGKQKLSPKVKSVKTTSDIPISSFQMRGIVEHYSTRKVSKDALEEMQKVFSKFFANLCKDMEAACSHANRKTINRDDMELIMRRQKFVTENRPLKVLIEENFPMEYQEILIPIDNHKHHIKAKLDKSSQGT